MTLRVVIVDDEPLAREGLRDFLSGSPDIEIVAECGNGVEAVEVINDTKPDLVFLDIQMPELDGFGVLEALGSAAPATVFVTAHDEYAIKAFEVLALDYLLKPVERARFETALERARRQLDGGGLSDLRSRMTSLLDKIDGRPRTLDRLVIKSRGRIFLLPVKEIEWIEADGNYARVHVTDKNYLIRETMSALEKKLDPERFVRIHRSAIVALDQVREIQPWFKGELMVILHNGHQLSLTRKYRKQLQGRLGQKL